MTDICVGGFSVSRLLQERIHYDCIHGCANGYCCTASVQVFSSEITRVEDLRSVLERRFPDIPKSHWFSFYSPVAYDLEVPANLPESRQPIGYTLEQFREDGSHCPFHLPDGLCALQCASGAPSHRWTYKPMLCYLYPVLFKDKVVTLDEQSPCWRKDASGTEAYKVFSGELLYLMGASLYEELCHAFEK